MSRFLALFCCLLSGTAHAGACVDLSGLYRCEGGGEKPGFVSLEQTASTFTIIENGAKFPLPINGEMNFVVGNFDKGTKISTKCLPEGLRITANQKVGFYLKTPEGITVLDPEKPDRNCRRIQDK